MGKKTTAPRGDAKEEPFLLTMLPFAGLALLLVLALFWRYFPENKPEARAEESGAAGALAVERWERQTERDVPIAEGRDFTLGPPDAPVTVVEFSDFECPYCRSATSDLKRVTDRFGDRVRVVFKNLPLDTNCNPGMVQQLHPSACRAAVVARCAGRQDEELFWKTHDALYRVSHLSESALEAAVADAGADPEKLERCVESGEALDEVKADVADAKELRVTGTPTFFINGRQVADYRDGALERIVEHILSGGSGT
jgi:protein-disulfide isomerase